MDDPFGSQHFTGRYGPKEYAPEIAKNCYFFKMGAAGFQAKPLRLIINNQRYRTFDALLDDISDKVPGMIFGVRHIYVAGTKREIMSMDELEDGGQYTCVGKAGESEKWAAPRMKPQSGGLKRLGPHAPPKRITVSFSHIACLFVELLSTLHL